MSGWNKSSKNILQNLALISQVGIMMLVPIFGGVLLGAFLDRFFKTGGIFLIVFVLIGVGTSFRNLYMLSIRQTKDYKDVENPSTYVNNYEKKIQEEKRDKENKHE
ncbi:AtpZ/AtpI family protein [Fusibacter bizertensis]